MNAFRTVDENLFEPLRDVVGVSPTAKDVPLVGDLTFRTKWGDISLGPSQ